MALEDDVKSELIEWLTHYKNDIRFDDALKIFSGDIEVTGGIEKGKWLSAIVDGARYYPPNFSLDLQKEFVGIFGFDNTNFYAEAMTNLIAREVETDSSFVWSEETDHDGSICCNVSLANAEEEISTDDAIFEDISNYDCEVLMNGQATDGLSAMDRLKNRFPEQTEAISYVDRKGSTDHPSIYYAILIFLEASDAEQIQSSLFRNVKVA